MDGVDTRDPQGGSAWTFFNQNLIEEIQVGGLGAPAEYGGFTGAIINTVTKSGEQRVLGALLDALHERLAGIEQHVAGRARPESRSWRQSAITKKLMDYTVQMGGPIKKDKAFFFAQHSALLGARPIRPVPSRTRRTSARAST